MSSPHRSATGRLRDTHPVGRMLRDAPLAVGLAAVGIAVYPHLPNTALVVAMCLPLVLRRAYPWAALAATGVAAVVHVVVLADLTLSVVAVPIVVHGLARWSTVAAARTALAMGLIGAVVGPARWLTGRPEPPTLGGWLIPIAGLGGVIVAAFVVGRRAREREELQAQRGREALAERERTVRQAADDERHEVAREIHDLVAHSLAVIAVQAEGGRATVVRHPHRSAEILSVIADTSREALDELRRVVAVLRRHEPVAADYRPAVGLDDVADLVARLDGRARLCLRGDPHGVGPLVGLTVYRIVQESLTNVLRHAGPAARAEVAVTVTDREVTVRVRDDGRGDAADSDRPGTGLVAMRERVQLHDGTLSHGRCDGGGFEVRAVLPVHQPAHQGGTGA